jgi:hypothetical protein
VRERERLRREKVKKKASEKKKNGPRPGRVTAKKNKEALSLPPHSYKNTYVIINMSGARSIVFYFATRSLSPGASVSSFLFVRKAAMRIVSRVPKMDFFSFFLFSRECVVCVSADRLSLFFVCATPARARVSFVLFDDDDDDDDARVTIQLAPPES